ncbi:sigma 54-interacting transcriptional regulator [Metallumcola ferriviriculae]|uniref:Sigma 54-interacting transcriptional regulator n=1 Tax=Metallumcola ferriviriculae TaxID=3039180 RepID=A0AAU0UU61_9FIRM|nr:sigma 54-interacting transcriptional regulator [Desulfitibacteraceae bacterium MK1]
MGSSQKDEAEHYKLQLEALMEHSYDGIYISDGEGNPVNMNEAFAEFIGVSRDELFHLHVSELISKGYIPESVVMEVLEQKKEVTRMINYRTGKETIVTGVPVLNEAGEIFLVICNLRDLTELKTSERELKETKKITEEYRQHIASFFEDIKQQPFGQLIYRSRKMNNIKQKADKVAQVDTNVLITGETGVGKDIIARVIHQLSKRVHQGSFIKVDCASIPEQLLEAELFGYEKGSFTDARKDGKIGRLELASNGTLFLDEIGELPVRLQVKLLNVIQDRKVTRIGGLHAQDINFRVICATNRNLEQMIKEGSFREDLYFRLKVVTIQIPPLRERKEDIRPLAEYYMGVFNKRYDLQKIITEDVMKALMNYDWPGNVRELANVVEQMLVLSSSQNITLVDLPDKILEYQKLECAKVVPEQTHETNYGSNLKESVDKFEKMFIEKIIKESETIKQAADRMGIDVSTLTRKRQKYGIEITK